MTPPIERSARAVEVFHADWHDVDQEVTGRTGLVYLSGPVHVRDRRKAGSTIAFESAG